MIVFEQVSKSFGSSIAVDTLSLSIDAGEIVGILGPNGAGKTTALRILCGFFAPSSGRVTIDGIDVAREPERARSRLGYLPEHAPLYGDMRVGEYLAYRARLKLVTRGDVKAYVGDALAKTKISDVSRRLISELSKGYRQRVALADALLAKPRVLALDEPSSSLDPGQRRDLRRLLQDIAPAHTVVLSSHVLAEVEAVATRIVIIAKGKLVADGSAEQLRRGPDGKERALEDVYMEAIQ